ncbi:hypothetical protein [Streptomyces angustmyceticus]|uniref:hypothetical protein n=1 Tax=Streptomyces angustmyceticus TaxID=285578 RepID=UPI001FC910E9|nr:hypothetical protein [Streptomyces angustmyceticus]
MAADILAYGTHEVPVGEDQAQHVELTRDLAVRFNRRYGATFVVPRTVHPPVAARVKDLQDPASTMGKSRGRTAGVVHVLDEPEAALSFSSCLELVGLMDELGRSGAQIVCATHSPLLTALPGAAIVEVGEHGMRRVEWAELGLVDHWRRYLNDPRKYLRHVLEG